MRGERLTPDEDQAMRRLHWFEVLGCELSSALRNLKDGWRSRDRRTSIREPGASYVKGAQTTAEGKNQDIPSYWTH